MSGLITPFGRSGIIVDKRKLTIRAYARITSANPSSSAFDFSYNVSSISTSSSEVTLNFIEKIFNPQSIISIWGFSTENHYYFSFNTQSSGLVSSHATSYRKNTEGATDHTDAGALDGATIVVYGGA
jgi:hypothetical protein